MQLNNLVLLIQKSNSTQTELELGNKFKYKLQVTNQNDSNHGSELLFADP